MDSQDDNQNAIRSSELLPGVYDDLRKLARGMVSPSGAQSLTATALVHEAWLRVTKNDEPQWESRRHFFGAAAQAMRRILLNRIRDKNRIKRSGQHEHVALEEVEVAAPGPENELLALDQALDLLAAQDPLAAEIVGLHYFVGLKWAEIAEMTGLSEREINRQWAFARAWLQTEIKK